MLAVTEATKLYMKPLLTLIFFFLAGKDNVEYDGLHYLYIYIYTHTCVCVCVYSVSHAFVKSCAVHTLYFNAQVYRLGKGKKKKKGLKVICRLCQGAKDLVKVDILEVIACLGC